MSSDTVAMETIPAAAEGGGVGGSVQNGSARGGDRMRAGSEPEPTTSSRGARMSVTASARRLMAPGSTTPIPLQLATAALRIAVTAAALGVLIGLTVHGAGQLLCVLLASSGLIQSQYVADTTSSALARPQLHFYLCAWAIFHLLEFVITARYNPSRLYADSFLIQNGIGYHIAHICGIAEFVAETAYLPQWKQVPSTFVWTGLALLLIGQIARSLAMIHAGGNFSHEVATRKRDDHKLVTDGIYAVSRHPSYFGFFYWAVGTQILLANPLSTVVFAAVLWRFFHNRIQGEEAFLNYFFKDAYKQYRAKTYTLIPFIR